MHHKCVRVDHDPDPFSVNVSINATPIRFDLDLIWKSGRKSRNPQQILWKSLEISMKSQKSLNPFQMGFAQWLQIF